MFWIFQPSVEEIDAESTVPAMEEPNWIIAGVLSVGANCPYMPAGKF